MTAMLDRPTLYHEITWRELGVRCIAGVDEAGCGPLAGPVCVAAVILPEEFEHDVLHDSKQLTEVQRERIYGELVAREDVIWSVVMIEVDEIDAINILQARWEGMRRAVRGLPRQPDGVLIDGRPVPNFAWQQQALVGGDAISLSIAAASVIAKVTRDRYMVEASKLYPQYEFDRHKGYSTRKHLEALRLHGPCPIHRRSFAPVSQLVFTFEQT